MEKQLSTIFALIFKIFSVFGINPPTLGAPGGIAISYLSFLHGAALFFFADDRELVPDGKVIVDTLATTVTDAMIDG